MRLFICCVRDVRGDVYWNPVFVQSLGIAEREFSDHINRPAEDNTLYKHPQDFELLHLGFFDSSSGRLEILHERVQLVAGSSVARSSPAELKAVQ